MAKKSAISGEYIITVEDSGTIRVCKIAENTLGALRECANAKNFAYDAGWTTRQFGSKLIKEFGSDNMAEIGEFTITKLPSGTIETFQIYLVEKRGKAKLVNYTCYQIDKPNGVCACFP